MRYFQYQSTGSSQNPEPAMDSTRESTRSSTARMSIRKKKKKEREKAFLDFWNKTPPSDCDVITDVIDKGDHVKITSCSKEASVWWLDALQSVYPEDKCHGRGDRVKWHPDAGVTLQLDKGDGTLRIKGKKHLEWFNENIDKLLTSGNRDLAAAAELGHVIDMYTRLEDGYTVHDLLDHLPNTGALKHGPTYIYRLWRGLLDQWGGRGGDIYVISPLIDARRVSDILLFLIKHRQFKNKVHLFTMPNCDGETKWAKVLKDAKDLIRELKSPNKKRLVAEERIRLAEERVDVTFGRFHCKMIATCDMESGQAELLLTSASFHKWHFDVESGDTLVYFKLEAEHLVNNYLAPLGLEHQVSLLGSSDVSEEGTVVADTVLQGDNAMAESNALQD